MALPIRTLPIVEHWDCHGCARCCRGSVIPLNPEDLARIESQQWDEHPEYRGRKTTRRAGLFSRHRVLAKRRDGSCVFLLADGRCRIHAEHGADAKPEVCRLFPLQIVPSDKAGRLTLRRSCPSAAASRGRELQTDRDDLRDLLKLWKGKLKPPAAPPIRRRQRLPWKDLDRVFRSIERLMLDRRFPIVRRLAHALMLCNAIESCDFRRLEGAMQSELLSLLEAASVEEASSLFSVRERPRRTSAGLFRQTAFHHLRLHPQVKVEDVLRDRVRLSLAALRFLRGRGEVPTLGAWPAGATFVALEEPLGHLAPEVAEPLSLYFEAAAASARYALLRPRGWSVVDGFRGLALGFPVALWLLRLASRGSNPTCQMMVDIVVALDRGLGFEPLTGSHHRRRIRGLARPGVIGGLLAWYAR